MARKRSKLLIPMKGRRFGRLIVVRDSGSKTRQGNILWLCRCDCGKRGLKVWGVHLRQGLVRSCGCLNAELSRLRRLKHGGTGTLTYKSWQSMRNRCLNPKAKGYKYWGGRGITICERWLGEHGFENFMADLGPRPEGQTLERIDVDGNYEPSNCRWATAQEQRHNQRNMKLEVVEGIEKDLGIA